MDIFPSFPSLLWSLPEIHQVSVEVGSMCAENTRWNSQGIQRGIFIRAWYKWCTSKCVPLDSLGENSIDIISITILTRLHPLTLINEKRYRRLLIIARLRRMPDRNLCIVHRESFSRDRLKSGRRKQLDRGMPFDYASCVCNYDINLRRETLGGMEILISIGVGSGANRFIWLDLYLDRRMYRAMWEQLRIEVLNG